MTDLDYVTALRLQAEFETVEEERPQTESLSDAQLAWQLQEQFETESNLERPTGSLVYDKKKQHNSSKSLVDPSWELVDPTPDIYSLFAVFDDRFFWSKLKAVCVSWSKKMTTCAGICSYQGRGGLCHITLSEPLLKLRPRKDLIETLLHEMIHAYLFVTANNRDRDGHGPEFHKHMYRINKETGTNITVYHSFHAEVELYKQHWWRCNGPCQKWKPYFGTVRRATNRAPGPNDNWFQQHQTVCGGTFIKVKEPEKKGKEEKMLKKGKENKEKNNGLPDIRKYISTSSTSNTQSKNNISTLNTKNSGNTSKVIPSSVGNIHGFTNGKTKLTGQTSTKLNSNTIVITKKPSTSIKDDGTKVIPVSKPLINDSLKNTLASSDAKSADLNLVRNHWVNKFGNTSQNVKISRSQSVVSPQVCLMDCSTGSNKRRRSETITTNNKVPKLDDSVISISSVVSDTDDLVLCPVCNKRFSSQTINIHLDNCLDDFHDAKSSANDISTSSEPELFDNDIDLNFDKIVCNNCKKLVPIQNIVEHTDVCVKNNEKMKNKKCPLCDVEVDLNNYDVHVEQCMQIKFDDLEKEFGVKDMNEEKNKENEEEKVPCLACGKSIIKSHLNSHMEDCLNETFANSDNFEFDDDSDVQEVKNDDSNTAKYNCPLCLILVSEKDMNSHIDVCLNINENS